MYMKRIVLLLSVIVAAFMLSSCSTTRFVSAQDDYNSYWTGHSYAEIINAYGAPDRETSDGQDGVILIYEKEITTTVTRSDMFYHYYPFGPSFTTTTSNAKEYVHFYVNPSKVCYQVKTNSVKAAGKEVDTVRTVFAAVGGTLLAVGLLPFFIW